MKRDRHAEGEAILKRAENTLRESLTEILAEVVESGEPLFFNSQFNPHNLPKHLLSKRGEALLQTSLTCVEMREALGLSVTGSVAEQYLASCAEASSSDPHRYGPRRLAAALLERLSNVV